MTKPIIEAYRLITNKKNYFFSKTLLVKNGNKANINNDGSVKIIKNESNLVLLIK